MDNAGGGGKVNAVDKAVINMYLAGRKDYDEYFRSVGKYLASSIFMRFMEKLNYIQFDA